MGATPWHRDILAPKLLMSPRELTELFLRTFWSFAFEYSTRRGHRASPPAHRTPLTMRRLAVRGPAGEWVRLPGENLDYASASYEAPPGPPTG